MTQREHVDTFHVHICRRTGRPEGEFTGFVQAGDARFAFWTAKQLFEILSLELGEIVGEELEFVHDGKTVELDLELDIGGHVMPITQ